MNFIYHKLKGRIKEKCNTQAEFAGRLGISEAALSARLNNSTAFTQTEIVKSLDILEISPNEIKLYFFTPFVQNN